ncbi:MAG: serine/threonine-protein kinase [Myxococcota bacterium]
MDPPLASFADKSDEPDLSQLLEVGEIIGSGGMAEVYSAVHRQTRQPLAMKRIKPELAHRTHLRQRFANEVDLLERCRGPYVLDLVVASTWDGTPAFVAERCVGSLHDVARERPLPLQRSLGYTAEILAALDRVHQLGVVHRDIKPSNLLIAQDGSLRLADFGIARHPSRRLTAFGRRVGTPNYAAPDLVADPRQAVPSHDLFAVGLLLFAISTHLRTSTLTRLEDRDRTLARFPAATAHLVDRATALDPDARYTSAAEMALDVQRAMAALGPAQAS